MWNDEVDSPTERERIRLVDRTYRSPSHPDGGALVQIERIGVHMLRFELQIDVPFIEGALVQTWLANGWTSVHAVNDVCVTVPRGRWWLPRDPLWPESTSNAELVEAAAPVVDRLRKVALEVLGSNR